VIRGGAALDIRPIPFEADLSVTTTEVKIDPAAVEQALAAGYRDGFEAGERDGYAAGMAAAQQTASLAEQQRTTIIDEALSALAAACDQLRRAQASAVAGTEDEIAAAAFAVAEAVIDRELAVSSDPGRDAVARALALAPAGDAVIRLHPSDIETLGDLPGGREISLVSDPSVERAGAIVQVGACTIDAQIGTAVQRVREALGL
jgi:flagellar assembly protein FliH